MGQGESSAMTWCRNVKLSKSVKILCNCLFSQELLCHVMQQDPTGSNGSMYTNSLYNDWMILDVGGLNRSNHQTQQITRVGCGMKREICTRRESIWTVWGKLFRSDCTTSETKAAVKLRQTLLHEKVNDAAQRLEQSFNVAYLPYLFLSFWCIL